MFILTFMGSFSVGTTLGAGREQPLSVASFAATPIIFCHNITDFSSFAGKYLVIGLVPHTVLSAPTYTLLIPANSTQKPHFCKASPALQGELITPSSGCPQQLPPCYCDYLSNTFMMMPLPQQIVGPLVKQYVSHSSHEDAEAQTVTCARSPSQ